MFCVWQDEILQLGKRKQEFVEELKSLQVQLREKRAKSTELSKRFKVKQRTVGLSESTSCSVNLLNHVFILYRFARSTQRFHTQKSTSQVRVTTRQQTTVGQSEECLRSARDLRCCFKDNTRSSPLRRKQVLAETHSGVMTRW